MDKFAYKIAAVLLLIMFLLMVGSSWNDSATFDEVAHIGAGYTYLKYQDMRLNPEHPPLLKNLAALPLLFLNLQENITTQSFWTMENVNDRQWAAGNYLLYEVGNNPDQILFWSRLPIMLLSLLFGWMFFKWVSGQYGQKVGLLALFFFTMSPTVLAHSRFVTTDLGAAFGFFLGIVTFIKFLSHPSRKSLLIAGFVLGLGLLFKFSLILLLPTYFIIALLWAFSKSEKLWKILGKMILIGVVALLLIQTVYIFHVWNYPQEQHIRDVKYILGDYKVAPLAALDVWLVEHKLTRPLGHYFFGFLMVARRTAGGNTAYFMGEVSSQGWWSYFPLLALLKEQLAFLLLGAMALYLTAKRIWIREKSLNALKGWVEDNIAIASSIVFVTIYWASSVLNPLNIGVRHVLPTFLFVYFLVARETTRWLNSILTEEPKSIFDYFKNIYQLYIKPFPKYIFVGLLMLWMFLDILLAFPYYLSYYNVLGGGLRNGYKIATDSNYDWGQDLKRLAIWKGENGVEKLYLDYFGGGSPKYYLGEPTANYESWWSARGKPPARSYLAVSLNSLTGNQAAQVGDVKIKPEDSYPWLKNVTPYARAGSSILIFKF